MSNCLIPAWILGSGSEDVDINTLIDQFRTRVESEEFHAQLNPTSYEISNEVLQLWIEKFGKDLELALNRWHSWVKWRHKAQVDLISDQDIEHELTEGIIQWRGRNKEGMRCCVITGRNLHPNRVGTPESFKKFVSKTIEDNLKESLYLEQKKVCVIYDRRGLTYDNIDPNLYNYCLSTISLLKDFHYDRIGAMYIVHTNWFFWTLYHFVVSPIFYILGPRAKLVVVDTAEELLEHFDSDQLFLLSTNDEEADDESNVGESDTGESLDQ